MKKSLIASLAVIGCAAVVATLALGGGPKLNAIFETKATSKSFTFSAATGSQFTNTEEKDVDQVVDVVTGSSSPIMTIFTAREISSLAFGQNGRFVEVHPIADENKFPNYSLGIGINNLTHFAIDVGVENDGGEGYEDMYDISLLDESGLSVKQWYSCFELDEERKGTKHFEWGKGDHDDTVVEVFLQFDLEKDSADTNLYIESISLTWEC